MSFSELIVDEARLADMPTIIEILGEGQRQRTDFWNEETAPRYEALFRAIAADPGVALIVAREDEKVLGVVQLVFTPGLTLGAPLKASLESVFIAASARGRGIGAKLVAAAEHRARTRGARVIRLLSHKDRVDAHRFYRNQGYAQSHEGFTKVL
ncbi:MAG: GNAT family N-acetyltransferase [Proteobacteria bacterium]|nr:GNAT family N-acetyltransferase [Pseudomonadota bacterium]